MRFYRAPHTTRALQVPLLLSRHPILHAALAPGYKAEEGATRIMYARGHAPYRAGTRCDTCRSVETTQPRRDRCSGSFQSHELWARPRAPH